jgi:hypothetical protein
LRLAVGKCLFQGGAVDQLQDQVLQVTLFAELIDSDDVRVRELAGGRGLAGKSQLEFSSFFRARKLVGPDDLDRHGPADGGVESAEDHAHRPAAQFFQKLVGTNGLHRHGFPYFIGIASGSQEIQAPGDAVRQPR